MGKAKPDDFEKGLREITRAMCDMDPDEVYKAGTAEGRRLERLALKRWGHVDLGENYSRRTLVDQYLEAARSKRSKPKGRMSK